MPPPYLSMLATIVSASIASCTYKDYQFRSIEDLPSSVKAKASPSKSNNGASMPNHLLKPAVLII
jgi:hypothetical protein